MAEYLLTTNNQQLKTNHQPLITKNQQSSGDFNFEDLIVWQRSIDFTDMVYSILEKLPSDRKHYRLIEQMEAACAGIAMNIAEGKGRNSKKEFVQFLYYSRGSLFEVVTLLTIFHRRSWLAEFDFIALKTEAAEIGKMLNALITSIKRTIPNPKNQKTKANN